MTARKVHLDGFPSGGEFEQWGREARRTYVLITKASNKARANWLHLGQIAWDVKQSAPRGTGCLSLA